MNRDRLERSRLLRRRRKEITERLLPWVSLKTLQDQPKQRRSEHDKFLLRE